MTRRFPQARRRTPKTKGRPVIVPCPTPRKRQYPTQAHATRAAAATIDRARTDDGALDLARHHDLLPYRCCCGWWHVGHRSAWTNRPRPNPTEGDQ